MKHYSLTAGVVMAVLATCVACDKIKPPLPQLQKSPAAPAQVDSQGAREDFKLAAQKELEELRGTITELKVKAETANQQTKAKLGKEIEKLETQWREAQQRLMTLKASTAESWSQLKAAFSQSMDSLKSGIDSLRKSL